MGETKQKSNNSPNIISNELQIREYQVNIAEKCVNKNSLVVLPTGLGKTIIAVLVANKILNISPPNSKIIVLAPTRPLINQHYETFLRFLKIKKEKLAILTGKILPENRLDIFEEHEIFFYTPQTLRNDLVQKRYLLDNTALIIFDEAHHASAPGYAYTMIADTFIDHNPDGVILGLTASPGSSKNKINALCQNLHIPLDNIHIRTRKDEDVKTYLKPMNIYKVGVNLTTLMEDMYQLLTVILEERLQYLSQVNILGTKGENLYKKIIRKDLLKLNVELVNNLKTAGDKTGLYSAISINAQALILFHMLELVEQQGLNILLDYLNKLNKEAKKKSSSKATKILASDGRLQRVYLELQRNAEFSPENLIHPKYKILVKIIQEELENNPSSKILVFIKLRDSIRNIVQNLKAINPIKPVRFVGQATKSQDDKGLSQKRQIEILNEFKKGIYNTLLGTSVAEEGLDIAECDLVIFYDVVASEIRLIQRKGRTARHREGRVVILYTKGTRDDVYLRIALSKLNRMNVNLKKPHQLNDSYRVKTPQSISLEEKLSPKEEYNIHRNRIPLESRHRKVIKRNYQSKIATFIDGEYLPKSKNPVKISKSLPMKYGLRKKLQNDNILYDIEDSDLHIVLFNKVLIQIYEPKEFDFTAIISDIDDFTQISSLLIIVFDFIEFKEEIEGEKRLLKRKIKEFSKQNNFQVINIDNEEELYFIIKNIVENPK